MFIMRHLRRIDPASKLPKQVPIFYDMIKFNGMKIIMKNDSKSQNRQKNQFFVIVSFTFRK